MTDLAKHRLDYEKQLNHSLKEARRLINGWIKHPEELGRLDRLRTEISNLQVYVAAICTLKMVEEEHGD